MSRTVGPITLDATGVQEYEFGFQPTWARFTVSGTSSTGTSSKFSYGSAESSEYQYCHQNFSDPTSATSRFYNGKVIVLKERVTGTVTTVLEAEFDSFTNDGIKLNVITEDEDYSVLVECGT